MRVLWRCLNAPYRRARFRREDYWKLWDSGQYYGAAKSEFDYVLRLYLTPLIVLRRVAERVLGSLLAAIVSPLNRHRSGDDHER